MSKLLVFCKTREKHCLNACWYVSAFQNFTMALHKRLIFSGIIYVIVREEGQISAQVPWEGTKQFMKWKFSCNFLRMVRAIYMVALNGWWPSCVYNRWNYSFSVFFSLWDIFLWYKYTSFFKKSVDKMEDLAFLLLQSRMSNLFSNSNL